MKLDRSKIAAAIDRMFKTKATGQKRIYPDGRRTSAEQDRLCDAVFGADLCDQATRPDFFKAAGSKPATARKTIDNKALAAEIASKASAKAQKAIDDWAADIKPTLDALKASNLRAARRRADLLGEPLSSRFHTNGVH